MCNKPNLLVGEDGRAERRAVVAADADHHQAGRVGISENSYDACSRAKKKNGVNK